MTREELIKLIEELTLKPTNKQTKQTLRDRKIEIDNLIDKLESTRDE